MQAPVPQACPAAVKIAQLMAGAPRGGAERFFERLCVALHGEGHTILPMIRADPAREARLRQAGLAPECFGFGGPLDFLTCPRLRRRLDEAGPALVIAWMNRAARHAPRGPWQLAGRIGGYYDLRHYRHCDLLIGNTRGILAHLAAQGADPAILHHVPNFADDLAGARPARLEFPDGRPVLLAMGRLHRNKGFDVLLRAMALLPDAVLALAGDGPEREALQALARQTGAAGRVRFLPWTEDVGGLLAASDVLVVPSRSEVLGNVVIEGFSAGIPVVAAASAGPRELIAHGVDGLLFPVDDETALAREVGAALANPAIGARGRVKFEAEHALQPVMRRWNQFLQSLA